MISERRALVVVVLGTLVFGYVAIMTDSVGWRVASGILCLASAGMVAILMFKPEWLDPEI